MADRYWVGGTDTWNGTAGTKWATTSGGAGGASVPTSADDVFFDVLSVLGNCTIGSGNNGAKSINCTGFTGTITGTAGITVSGSVTLVAAMTYTHTATVTFNGTGTLTTAGKNFSIIVINGSGITVQLGDALNISTRTITVTQGTFTTNNYNVTAGSLSSSNSNTRTINLGSSTITLSSNSGVQFSTSTNLTFNAGTSQITLTGANSRLIGGSGQTFYNVSFTSTIAGIRQINGANTFNNLTLNASATGLSQLVVDNDQTVSGTFTCVGSSSTARGFVRSVTIGTTCTITANAISANDCDFRDITIAGSAAGASPTRAGDCGGNSGITFPAAKTVYRVGTGTAWNGLGVWSDTSGGSGNTSLYSPLAQDTVVINNDTALTGTLNFGSVVYNVGSIDCSTRTTGITLNHNGSFSMYGNYTLGSGVTVSGTSNQNFSGRGTQTFTSAGKTITFQITVLTPTGTFQLGDAYSSSNTLTLNQGTFSAGTYNVTCTTFSSNNANTRTLNMGSGLWTLTGTGTVWNMDDSTNMTLNKGTANILLSNNTATSRGFDGDILAFNKITIGGNTSTSTTTFFGASTYEELASTKTVAHTVLFQDISPKTINTWSITGSVGNVVTFQSNTSGTRRTFNLTNVTSGIDYLAVKDIGVTDPDKFYVGANSTDNGNNSNVYFTAAPAPAASNSNFFLMFA